MQEHVIAELDRIAPLAEKGVLALSGQAEVDSCISKITALPQHTLFEECVSNLSHDASFIFVADMDEIKDSIACYKLFAEVCGSSCLSFPFIYFFCPTDKGGQPPFSYLCLYV